MLEADLKALLDLYGDEIKTSIQKRLKASNKYATGKAHNELIKKVTANSVSIEGWKYIEVISGGREPGKKAPPTKKIEEWIEARNISYKRGRLRSLAFIIAKRIGEKGIKGNNMLTSIRNEFIPRFDADLADIIQDEIVRITTKVGDQKTK
jgi:hypothetical protein